MIFGGFVSAFSQHFYFEPNIYETCIVFRITTLIKRKHQDRQSLKLHAIRAAVTVILDPIHTRSGIERVYHIIMADGYRLF